MVPLLSFIRFLIRSNVYIAVCAVLFTQTGAMYLLHQQLEWSRLLIIFSSTYLIYNLNIFLVHLLAHDEGSTPKMQWFNRHKYLIYLMLGINVVVLLYSLWHANWKIWLFFAHLGVVSILYNVPDRYAETSIRSIRSIPLIKVFLIGYVWAQVGVVYPALLHPQVAQIFEIVYWFGMAFLFIVGITLPFDIRDFYEDKRSNLLTVPGLIGIQMTKKIAYILIAFYSIGLLLNQNFITSIGILSSALLLVYHSSQNKQEWYYLGLVDGLIILNYLLILLDNQLIN